MQIFICCSTLSYTSWISFKRAVLVSTTLALGAMRFGKLYLSGVQWMVMQSGEYLDSLLTATHMVAQCASRKVSILMGCTFHLQRYTNSTQVPFSSFSKGSEQPSLRTVKTTKGHVRSKAFGVQEISVLDKISSFGWDCITSCPIDLMHCMSNVSCFLFEYSFTNTARAMINYIVSSLCYPHSFGRPIGDALKHTSWKGTDLNYKLLV